MKYDEIQRDKMKIIEMKKIILIQIVSEKNLKNKQKSLDDKINKF